MVANSNSTNAVLVRRDYSDNNVSNHTCDLGNSQSFEMYISDRQRYPCNQGCGINLFQPALIKAPYINYACLFSNLILFYTNRLETCMHNNCIWLCGNFGQPFNFYFRHVCRFLSTFYTLALLLALSHGGGLLAFHWPKE